MGLVDPDGSAAAAVKTGTAQYGRQEDGNSYGWLTGFTPCKNPEYIVTVLQGDQIERLPMPDRYTGESSNT